MSTRGAKRAPIAPGVALVIVQVALAGCYDVHTREGALVRDGSFVPRDAGPADDAGPDDDAGRRDSGIVLDAGPRDSGIDPFDAGPPDSGIIVFDAGPRDAGIRFDAGPPDSGIVVLDAGPRDAGIRFDAGPRDSGISFDAGLRDSGVVFFDAGPRDSGIDAARDAGVDASGPRSIALRFAPDDLVVVPDRPGLSVLPDTTFELWIRARGPGILSRKGQDAGQQHLAIRLEGTGDATEIVAGWVTLDLDRRELRAPFGAFLDRWTHVAYVVERLSASTLRATLYVDLTMVATADFPDDSGRAFNVEPLLFGRFDGDLDEIRLWNSARSLAVLRANAMTRIRGGTAGLAAYWALEEAGGQIVLDRSLRGNDGILGDRTMPDGRDATWIFDGPIP